MRRISDWYNGWGEVFKCFLDLLGALSDQATLYKQPALPKGFYFTLFLHPNIQLKDLKGHPSFKWWSRYMI